MNIQDWWPQLRATTRAWLIDHNGEAVPDWVAVEIVNAAKLSIGSEAGDINPLAVELSDADVDWIEAVANDEQP